MTGHSGEGALSRSGVDSVAAAKMPAGISHEGAVLQGVLWRQYRRVNAAGWSALSPANRGVALALVALADDEVPE